MVFWRRIMHFSLLFGLLSFTGLLTVIDCTPQNVPRQKVTGDIAPNVTVPQRTYNVKVGDRQEMTCSATGSPQPKLSWLEVQKNSIMSTSVIKMTQFIKLKNTTKGLQLVIRNISKNNDRIYICSASNRAGDAQVPMTVFVQVLIPPILPILTPLQDTIDIKGNTGRTAIFLMFMQHTPPGTVVYWELPPALKVSDKRLSREQFFNTQTKFINHVLQKSQEGTAYMFLKNVTPQDNGTYRCRVVTPKGFTTTRSVNLRIDWFEMPLPKKPCLPQGKSSPAPGRSSRATNNV